MVSYYLSIFDLFETFELNRKAESCTDVSINKSSAARRRFMTFFSHLNQGMSSGINISAHPPRLREGLSTTTYYPQGFGVTLESCVLQASSYATAIIIQRTRIINDLFQLQASGFFT